MKGLNAARFLSRRLCRHQKPMNLFWRLLNLETRMNMRNMVIPVLRRQLHEEAPVEFAVSEKPKETRDNSAVFDTLRDLRKLVDINHLRASQEWLSVLMRVGTSDSRPRDTLLKEVIDLRTQLLDSLTKCESLGIGYRSKSRVVRKAPVLPYGAYLDSWGSKRDVPANQRGLEMENRWGRFDSKVMIPVEKVTEMNVRSSFYKPPEEETTPCRAPLKKGGRCPRRDLRRCPLHGSIIPRDENGHPLQTPKIDKAKSKPAEKEPMTELAKASMSGFHSASGPSMGTDSSSSVAHLAIQAIANVREKDEIEARKKRGDRIMVKRKQSSRDREHNQAVLRDAALASSQEGFQDSSGEEFDNDVKMNRRKEESPRWIDSIAEENSYCEGSNRSTAAQ